MSVRMTLKTISKPDKGLDYIADNFSKMAEDVGKRAFQQIESPLLDELQFYPPPLPNQRYVRTYRLKRGWKAGIMRIGSDTFALVVSNATEYTALVVGSLAQAVSAAASFQRAIHQGRWPLATNTVAFWFEAYTELLDKEFASELSKFGTIRNRRRAFTRKTR